MPDLQKWYSGEHSLNLLHDEGNVDDRLAKMIFRINPYKKIVIL